MSDPLGTILLPTKRGDKMTKCDICSTSEAKYDARTNFGPWANVCELCFALHTPGKLGVGYGQLLNK